jgi:hypothetical protein
MRSIVATLLFVAACSHKSAPTDDKAASPSPTEAKPAAVPGGPVLEGVLPDGTRIPVQKLQPTGPVEPLHDGQWIEVQTGGKRNLAYTYTDRSVGLSAMGGPVSATPTDAEIKELVNQPPATWHDLEAFGPHALDPAEVAKLHLPAKPDWVKEFE